MLKLLKKEQGYALLIVLFLIVIIMVGASVFFRGSIGNAKIERRVDDNHLTSVAAEAGIDYTKQMLENTYFNKIKEIEDFVFLSIANTPKGQTVNYKKIQEQAQQMLYISLDESIADVNRIIKDPYGFKLYAKSFGLSNDNLKITFTGTIKGVKFENEKVAISKEVSFEQEFLIPDFNKSSNIGDNKDIPNMHKLYPDNVKEPSCSGNQIKNTKCLGQNVEYKSIEGSTAYFPVKLYKPNANLQVTRSSVYFKDGLDIENFNQVKQSKVYIDGSVMVKNMNGVDDSSMYINGGLKVNSNMKMKNSLIAIRGSSHFTGNSDISGNSLICVNGSAQFDRELKIEKGSKLVYWGSLATYGGVSGSGLIIQASNEADLWEQCLGQKQELLKWEDPEITDVKYN